MRYTFAFALWFVLLPATASARDHRVDQLPYGASFGCTSCHTTAAGGGVFTRFGSDSLLALVGGDLLQERDLDWSLMYHLDSDRDGFTNGEELNDPNGLWRIGDPNPIGGVRFHPGDRNSHPLATCGDGRVTPPEECDGTNFRDQSCIGLGLEDGTLVCQADCTFDRSGCGGGEPTPIEPSPEEPVTTAGSDDAGCSSAAGTPSPGALAVLLALCFAARSCISRRRQTS